MADGHDAGDMAADGVRGGQRPRRRILGEPDGAEDTFAKRGDEDDGRAGGRAVGRMLGVRNRTWRTVWLGRRRVDGALSRGREERSCGDQLVIWYDEGKRRWRMGRTWASGS